MDARARTRRWIDGLRARLDILAWVGVGLVGLGFLLLGLGLGAWNSVCRDCPSVAQIFVFEPKQSTRILAHDGRPVAELFQERRTPVAIESLPRHVPLAFVAVEDRRFFRHSGLDARGLARGGVNLLMRRWTAGGGSTITQQLARNMFEEEVGFARRIERKLKEFRVAKEIETVYTKEQILEAYLNQINFGPGWWGIETAAQRFFGKPARELNPAEAALLAAVIKNPGGFSPFRNPENALARRNMVLRMMADQGILPRDQLDGWREWPLPDEPHGTEGAAAPYFVEWVRSFLDARYGGDLYERGFRIYTTLDLDLQEAAEDAMLAGFERIEARPGFRHPRYDDVMEEGGTSRAGESPYLQGMFIAIDPATGDIKALIGGRDFRDSRFNRATQARRQPGSTFKPFVFAAGIASGIPASHVIYDAPILLEQAGADPWSPRNYDGEFHGPLTLRDGLKRSINLVAVKLGLEVGVETVAQFARRLGISTPIPRVPAITIGAADVIPLDMAEAYSAFAMDGMKVEPRGILRVEDAAGRLLWEAEPERAQVLDTLVASVVRDMLSDVVNHGTGYTIRNPGVGNLPYDVPAAGKTGTTNDATDVWFVGFTPDLLAGVWFGFDRPRRIMSGATGGVYAAPVWADFMRAVYMGENALRGIPAAWERPAGLTTRRVDRESGRIATDWCPRELVYDEIYIPGTEPDEACDIHGPGLYGAPLRGLFPDTLERDTLTPRPQRRRF